MTKRRSDLRGDASSTEPYSPERRTALLLTGTGTAGAYHAGVLKALHEAGVKIDIVAGRGMGAVSALFCAVDGASRLWEERGVWRSPEVARLYPWRRPLRIVAWAAAAAVAIVAAPLAAMALGLVVFPLDFLAKMVGIGSVGGLTAWYVNVAQRAFAPTALPTWLPRLVLLTLGAAAIVAAVTGARMPGHRHPRGPRWWRLLASPLSAEPAIDQCWAALWELLRGATQLRQPGRDDLGRRYAELLNDNLGQPGFRELLIAAHDVDAGRDVVFALVHESRRRDLVGPAARLAEVVDLAGLGRGHLADAVASALSVPGVNEYHAMTFAADSYWRGETHRLCDRVGATGRLIEELVALGVTQIVVISPAPEVPGPHALAAPRLEGRARVGEWLQSAEMVSLRDAAVQHAVPGLHLYTIRPAHNPIGPFDFEGGFDDRSARTQPLAELITRGYEDAHHQFVEPFVGAAGERVGRT